MSSLPRASSTDPGPTSPAALLPTGVAAAATRGRERGSGAERGDGKSRLPAGVTQKFLLALNRAAMEFWHRRLLASPDVLAYLQSRGYDDPAGLAATYRLGYAPGPFDSKGSFVRAVLSKGFLGVTDPARLTSALVAAGLARPPAPGQSPRDLFYGRLVFPIARKGPLEQLGTPSAEVIGFGARLVPGKVRPLPDGEEPPKYLNTPETVLFKKRSTFYGGSWALGAMQSVRQAVILEGYFDLIRVREAGILHVAACCGTAVTADHMGVLQKAAGPAEIQRVKGPFEVVMATDADVAGRRAAEKGARVVLRAGFRAKIASFAGGKDPDDLLRGLGAEGPARFRQILADAQTPVLNYLDVLCDRAGAPPWDNSLRSLVATLRNLQRRAIGAPTSLVGLDADRVTARLALESQLALEPGNVAALFRQAAEGALSEFDEDWEVGG